MIIVVLLLPLLLLVLLHQRRRRRLTLLNRRWTGQEVVNDLLNYRNATRIHSQLRMQLDTFVQLRDWLVMNTKLDNARYISIKEKLLIFIYITSSSALNRAAQERFNRGPASISRYILISLILNKANSKLGVSMRLLMPSSSFIHRIVTFRPAIL